ALDTDGTPALKIDVSGLTQDLKERLIRSFDAYEHLVEALDRAPAEVQQVMRSIEFGNAHALWLAIKSHVQETHGTRATELIAELTGANQLASETAPAFG